VWLFDFLNNWWFWFFNIFRIKENPSIQFWFFCEKKSEWENLQFQSLQKHQRTGSFNGRTGKEPVVRKAIFWIFSEPRFYTKFRFFIFSHPYYVSEYILELIINRYLQQLLITAQHWFKPLLGGSRWTSVLKLVLTMRTRWYHIW